ncbi:MAG: hypothetical protein CBD27_11460 [Rhodospirillaceae bacterium TMED167]|nr:hypothetical protein [Rhodospirillaceae bacterium]OUW24212.1 MAG: hypothetical protein CBD27_11460 [Rhodospirillaceae bacterium TMED167]
MVFKKYRPLVFCATALLSGCSFSSDSLLPTLTGEDPAGPPAAPAKTAQAPTPRLEPVARPALRPAPAPMMRTARSSQTANGAAMASTFVSGKVAELRQELRRLQTNVSKTNSNLQQLRSSSVQKASNYQRAVADVNSRLQVGTTPGNPILVQQFNTALALLNKISTDISSMNKLTTQVTSDSTLAAFLSENTRAAFRLSGALDEDHAGLAMLEDEVNRTVVLVDRLLKELSEDIQRQTNFVATERSNMNTLSASIKTGEIMGASLTNRALTAATSGAGAITPRASGSTTLGRRPLVVIRFDRKDVAYDQALYNAVSRTLESRPGATFALVAVAPNTGGAAKVALNRNKARRNAENVLRTLQRMGLPTQRVALSERTGRATSTEVHLYLN